MKKDFLYRKTKNSVTAIVMSILCFAIVGTPVVKTEAYGKKVYPAGGETIMTSDFRTPSRPSHNGIDILRGDGKIYAADAGTVVLAEEGCPHDSPSYSCECNGGCGNHVAILHEDGYQTKYLHLKDGILVKTGDKVKKGQHIGMMGSTGRSSAVHLHFSVLNASGAYVSPNDYLGGEYAVLPPEDIEVRLSKNSVNLYQPVIVTYNAKRAEFYIAHVYDDEGNLMETLNSNDEQVHNTMTISFETLGRYSLQVEAYNETGKIHSKKKKILVFDGAFDLTDTSDRLLTRAKKSNRGAKTKRKAKVNQYNLHVVSAPSQNVVATPPVFPTPDVVVDKADEDTGEKDDKVKNEKKKEKKLLKWKDYEYKFVGNGTAVKLVRYLSNNKNVNVPERIKGKPVKILGKNLFVNNDGMLKDRNVIKIPGSVKRLEKRIALPNANAYRVAKNNTKYSSEKGVLYNKAKTKLIRFPVRNLKSDKARLKKGVYQINNKVEAIGRHAFKSALFVGYKMPKGLKKIGESAFANNSKLTKVKIPKSIEYIGVNSFAGSFELKRVDLYRKRMPKTCLNTAVFSSAKIFVPKGSGSRKYKKLSEGGYDVSERRK